jgi:hypothetical protein
MLLSELFDISGDDLPLLEMANYDSKDTNIGQGHVFISTKYDTHGCRIKYVLNWNEPSKCLTFTIPGFVIVVDTLGTKIDNITRKEVLRYAIKNKDIILKYWNDGLTMNNHDRYALENTMQPLTDAEKKASRKLELVYK